MHSQCSIVLVTGTTGWYVIPTALHVAMFEAVATEHGIQLRVMRIPYCTRFGFDCFLCSGIILENLQPTSLHFTGELSAFGAPISLKRNVNLL
jgi:hypothetical protein